MGQAVSTNSRQSKTSQVVRMSSEKFCLRWNNFETNISCAFKDIREEKQFFDITIACEDEQIQAHKVILSACSPFFKNVLYRNHHQHPLLYLKGVSFRDMEAVITFMYYGEVNVAQDDLNSFLQVAEDLRIKGLTQNEPSTAKAENKRPSPTHSPRLTKHGNSSLTLPHKHGGEASTHPDDANDDTEEIIQIPVVKSEPCDQPPPGIAGAGQTLGQKPGMAMYSERGQQMGTMMMQMDAEQFDESYGGEYDGHYEEESFDPKVGGQDISAGLIGTCPYCSKAMRKSNLSRHIRVQHTEDQPEKCEICNKVFKSIYNLWEHQRTKHGIFRAECSS